MIASAVVSAIAAVVQALFAMHVGSYAASADRLARANLDLARGTGVRGGGLAIE